MNKYNFTNSKRFLGFATIMLLVVISVFTIAPNAQSAQTLDLATLNQKALEAANWLGMTSNMTDVTTKQMTFSQWAALDGLPLSNAYNQTQPLYVMSGKGSFNLFGDPNEAHNALTVGIDAVTGQPVIYVTRYINLNSINISKLVPATFIPPTPHPVPTPIPALPVPDKDNLLALPPAEQTAETIPLP